MEVKINRYEYILNIALNKNISFKAARDIIQAKNTSYNFHPSNGDQININNIYKDNKNSLVYNFYKNLKVYMTGEKNKKGELLYFIDLTKDEIFIRNQIKKLTTINKSIVFDQKETFYKKTLSKIKVDYDKQNTTEKNRSILANDKKNTAGNYAINYKGKDIVLSYDRFTYEDFFNNTTLKNNEELNEIIDKKLRNIVGIEVFLKYTPKFIEEIQKKIIDFLTTYDTIQMAILNQLVNITDKKQLIKIRTFIDNI